MATQVRHRIQKQVVDLQLQHSSTAPVYQARIGNLLKNYTNARIGELLSGFHSGVGDIRLDRLHVDLGVIPSAVLEEQFEKRLLDALRDILKDIEFSDGRAAKYEVLPGHTKSETLRFYLLRGYMPWWASGSGARPGALLRYMLSHDPVGLKLMLRSVGNSAMVAKRIVAQFDEATVYRLIHVLEPSEADFIIRFSDNLQKEHEKKPVIQAGSREFREAKLELILGYLLNDRGTKFNRKEFVRYTIAALAARFNISYSMMLAALSRAIAATQKRFQHAHAELKNILIELSTQDQQVKAVPNRQLPFTEESAEKDAKLVDDISRTEAIGLVSYFFQHASFSSVGSRPGITQRQFDDVLDALMSFYSGMLREALHKLPSPAQSARIISRHLDEAVIRKLVVVLEPADAPAILSFTDNLDETNRTSRDFTTDAIGFKNVAWEFVMSYLLASKSTRFNTVQFVRQLIRQLAARYNRKADDLAILILQTLNSTPATVAEKASLTSILKEAVFDDTDYVVPDRNNDPDRVTRMADTLESYLLTGAMPWWAGHNELEPADILNEILSKDVEIVSVLLARYEHHSAVLTRLFRLLEHVIARPMSAAISKHRGIAALRTVFDGLVGEHRLATVNGLAPEHFFYATWIRHASTSGSSDADDLAVELISALLGEVTIDRSVIPGMLAVEEEFLLTPTAGQSDLSELIIRAAEEAGWIPQAYRGRAFSLKLTKAMAATAARVKDAWHAKHHLAAREIDQVIVSYPRAEVLLAGLRNYIVASAQGAGPFSSPSAFGFRASSSSSAKRVDSAEQFVATFRALFVSHRQAARALLNAIIIHPGQATVLYARIGERYFSEIIAIVLTDDPDTFSMFAAASEVAVACIPMKGDKTTSHEVREGWVAAAESVLARSNFNRTWALSRMLSAMAVRSNVSLNDMVGMMIAQLSTSRTAKDTQVLLDTLFALARHTRKDPSKSADLTPGSSGKQADAQKVHDHKQTTTMKSPGDRKQSEDPRKPEARDDLRKAQDQKPQAKKEEIPEGESLYVHNSGLVLINPFIPKLFEVLGYLVDRKFKDEAAEERAIHLLQYAATGQEQVAEYQLVLNKLLCGVPLTRPVHREVILTQEEKDKCDSLLRAVISQWTMLGQTSVDGLRGTFLIREGKLVNEVTHWGLTVEKKGFDVLIDRLPWTYGMIRFSWMEIPLNVTWR